MQPRPPNHGRPTRHDDSLPQSPREEITLDEAQQNIIERVQSSSPPQRIAAPAIDFSSPDLWTDATQKIINDFRTNLQGWTISYCPTCCRTHPFSQSQQLH
jgi:hypothetical protein